MPTALFSLSDKTGSIDLAQALLEQGWDFLASGGTAQILRKNGLPVTDITEYTGSPEILGGRVKTLHPAVSGGILARSTAADDLDLAKVHAKPIDLVACNLYPFEETVSKPGVSMDEAIENIDIGGVTLIRAAAKNFERVIVLIDPLDYAPLIDRLRVHGETSLEYRQLLALKAFKHTRDYDNSINNFISGGSNLNLNYYSGQTLRYGENWHQNASFFSNSPQSGPLGGKLLQGKPISYNNVLDLDAAWRAAISFEEPTVVIVKHLSPSGIASAIDLATAYPSALASDPVSAFGSVIAVNRPFDKIIAEQLGNLFIECIAAPGFTRQALEILSRKSNLRLLDIPDIKVSSHDEYRSIIGGMLRQSLDLGDPNGTKWKVVTQRQPTKEEWASLNFAWLACQHVKSNAIVFVKGKATVGIGGGQPNRVDCVSIAKARAGNKSRGAVMASDAFFPFPDTVIEAAKHGITAIIQPGGALRDELSINACDENKIAMVFTGVRHFRH
ncbi:MAG: bifunctional phosphoribosylaminoimidazolecarboxamide formyltransferase/IMP cyclohydrolase [Anaerolineales bacterium]|nr:bifunctional phosphoribosylaminoimidazolecarboxamide formyltransferase/IMP cyclohydrolase [Anaerolineales bacterium]